MEINWYNGSMYNHRIKEYGITTVVFNLGLKPYLESHVETAMGIIQYWRTKKYLITADYHLYNIHLIGCI